MGFIKATLTWIAMLLGLAGIAALFYLGGFMAWRQHQAMTSWTEVQGEVVTSRVVTSRGRRNSTNYAAQIQYRYDEPGSKVAGTWARRSTQVLPIWEWTSSGQSEAITRTSAFSVGSKPKVWVNPEDPNDAFILRQYQSWPIGIINAGILALVFWLSALMKIGINGKEASSTLREGGLRLIGPKETLAQIRRRWLMCFSASCLLPVAPGLYAILGGADAIGWLFWITVAISGVVLFIVGVQTLQAWRRCAWIGEPTVLVAPTPVITGGEVLIVAEVESFKASVSTLKLNLVCARVRRERRGKSSVEVRDELGAWGVPAITLNQPGQEPASLTLNVILPSELPGSGDGVSYPRVEWTIEIDIVGAAALSHKARYPLKVEGAADLG
ncbi:MAG: DUF3592 domain-containing protein [Phycisphaerales bacterium]|nr:DUF3592 domain-containing protein [Phycisphaerales bacterium]